MTADPLVSIVVPVRDGERYLRQSLDSIVAQTYRNREILLMDDASTDETPRIAASYGALVRYYRQPSCLGQFDNVNDGIDRARGEFVAVYHADDVYEPELVSKEVGFLRDHREVGAVFAMDRFIDHDGREVGRLSPPPDVPLGRALGYETVLEALLLHKNAFLRGPSSMVRAAVYAEVGRYREEQFGIAADLEMWLRIARRHPVAILDEHLFSYRRGHGSSSDRYDTLRIEPERYFDVIDQELERGGCDLVSRRALIAHEAHRAHDLIRLAGASYVLGRRESARAALAPVRARSLVYARHPRGGRLVVAAAALRALVRLPPVGAAARLLRRRLAPAAAQRAPLELRAP